MKFLIKIISVLLITSACTKVINVDLNSASPKLVIEGVITENALHDTVLISKTVNFSESNTFPAVSGAFVVISNSQGEIDTLKEVLPGKYVSSKITGKVGLTYSLNVFVEGKIYTAQSIMPTHVKFESLNIISQNGFSGQPSYFPSISYQDPANETNFYKFNTYIHSKKNAGYTLYDDKLTNGNAVTRTLFVSSPIAPAINDYYTVDMICIDKPTYDYFYSLKQSQGGNSGAPDNPVTNITGGALGYFGAQTLETLTTQIK